MTGRKQARRASGLARELVEIMPLGHRQQTAHQFRAEAKIGQPHGAQLAGAKQTRTRWGKNEHIADINLPRLSHFEPVALSLSHAYEAPAGLGWLPFRGWRQIDIIQSQMTLIFHRPLA